MKLLLVDDDPEIRGSVRLGFELQWRDVEIVEAGAGAEALTLVEEERPDLVLLDIGLPDMDGYRVLREVRAFSSVPVIMLTARDAIEDRVRGLDGGADDYLTKPFSLAELLARLRALARRGPVERPAELRVGALRLDPATREVWRGDAEVRLTAREFAVLETFMRRPGQVLSHSQLLAAAWDIGYEQRSNVVEVYIRYLREKIDRPFGVRSIETVRGLGYRLRRDGGT